jgi:hypothetical protein
MAKVLLRDCGFQALMPDWAYFARFRNYPKAVKVTFSEEM